MDKEDSVREILSTLQKPQWKASNSVTDWDLMHLLWKCGLLLTLEQVAALLSDMKRRGLIACSERRLEYTIVAMWGLRITSAGEDALLQHSPAAATAACRPPGHPSVPTTPEAPAAEPAQECAALLQAGGEQLGD